MDTDDVYENRFSFNVVSLLENYGWYMLIAGLFIAYIVNLLKPKITRYLEWKNDQEYTAKYHKNPDLLTQRLVAQRERVEQLQAQYEKEAEVYQDKLKQREAKKLEEINKKYENVNVGDKLGSSKDGNTKTLKPEYNPLMGDSSRSYRPVRKSPCSGGGCGR